MDQARHGPGTPWSCLLQHLGVGIYKTTELAQMSHKVQSEQALSFPTDYSRCPSVGDILSDTEQQGPFLSSAYSPSEKPFAKRGATPFILCSRGIPVLPL